MGGDSNLRAFQVTRAVRDLPVIGSVAGMVARREKGFIRADHGGASPANYNASRELEVLSNTPVSTGVIIDELSPHIGRRVVEVGAGLRIGRLQDRRGERIVKGLQFGTIKRFGIAAG